MKIIIKTLGCKANRYESDRIQEEFGDRFYNADILLINTCTVTHVADRKSRQAISHLKSMYPKAKVIVFGCGANTNPDGYKNLKNVDYVVQKREELDSLLDKLSQKINKKPGEGHFNSNRTRALVKIQDGCNNFCSYCIVPYARGREKSRPSKEILEEINNKIDKGYKEIVLTGINIGSWKENGEDLAGLIKLILHKTKIERLRLSSIEPQNFSQKFINLFNNPRFCPHLHIALQSGSNTILKAMNRRYDTNFFEKIVNRLRKAVPYISITTDVIVGFPGETEKLFKETLDFVKKMKFSKIHIFPYSKRKGTVAAKMPNQVPYEIKKKRAKKLAEIEKKMRLDFYKNNIGRIDTVLLESFNKDGSFTGFTSNYLKTRIQKSKLKQNTIANIELSEVLKNGQMKGLLKS